MSTDLSRKRSAHSPASPEALDLLTRLDHLNAWWLRADLFEHLPHLLDDLQTLLSARACFLYLAQDTTRVLHLAARSEQAQVSGPAQFPPGNEEFWTVLRDHWNKGQMQEINAACRQLFVLALGTQATSAIFAPLFAPRLTIPSGILMIAPARTWRPDDGLLLRQVSTPLALRLAEQRTRDQLAQSQLLNDFVRLLCVTPLDPTREETIRRQARLLGLDLAQPHLVILAQLVPAQRDSMGLPQVLGDLQSALISAFPGALLLLQESAEIIGLLPLTGTDGQALGQLKQTVRDLSSTMHLLLGVSNPARGLSDYARSYTEARDALNYAQHFHEGGVFHIQEVGPLRFLKLADARTSRATDRYSQAIEKLAEYDRNYHADLLYTLEKFLLAGGRYSQAARMMESEPGKAIAVGTVRQRVERMCEITEMDLLDSTLWLHLQLAIQVYHIQQS